MKLTALETRSDAGRRSAGWSSVTRDESWVKAFEVKTGCLMTAEAVCLRGGVHFRRHHL